VLFFEVILYLSGPANFRENYIKNVIVRLSVVPTTTNLNDSYSVLDAMTAEGATYTELFSLDSIDIDKP
jgi:hypothetical protein